MPHVLAHWVQCDAYDSGIVTCHLDYANVTMHTQISQLYQTENRTITAVTILTGRQFLHRITSSACYGITATEVTYTTQPLNWHPTPSKLRSNVYNTFMYNWRKKTCNR